MATGKPFKGSAANAALGSELAVQQLLDEVDERKSRKSRQISQLGHKSRHRLQHDEDVSTSLDEVEVKLSITPTAAPLFYSSDLLYASEPSQATTEKPSLYDTPFWHKYGFVIVHLSMVLCQSCFAAVNVFGKYGLIYVHPMVLIILRNVGTFLALFSHVSVPPSMSRSRARERHSTSPSSIPRSDKLQWAKTVARNCYASCARHHTSTHSTRTCLIVRQGRCPSLWRAWPYLSETRLGSASAGATCSSSAPWVRAGLVIVTVRSQTF
jgi:hypothetical protein